MRAAVLTTVGQPLEVRDGLELEGPRRGEVQLRMLAAGVCHSDLSMQDGTMLAHTPMVLGHEGIGRVVALGEGVEDLNVGARVVVGWVPRCGVCFHCQRDEPHLCEASLTVMSSGGLMDGTTRLRDGGTPVRQMLAAGLFAEETVVPASSVVPIPEEVPTAVGALFGCGVLTGVGAALHTAKVRPGERVAVFGCGGVGLNAVQGARIAGAERIFAVDVSPARLELAGTLGATDLVDAREDDAVDRIESALDGRGADVVLECAGTGRTLAEAVAATRRGGRCVLVGIPPMSVSLDVPAFVGLVMAARTIVGCWYGSTDLRRDVPVLVEHYRSGALRLDALTSDRFELGEVNEAFAALREGRAARPLLQLGPPA